MLRQIKLLGGVMERITFGRKCKTGMENALEIKEKKMDHGGIGDVMMTLGILATCFMLVVSFLGEETQSTAAVSVLNPNVIYESVDGDGKKEELIIPEKKDVTAEAAEWSVFDSVGMWFAELIFGESP
jgi:hypothetical protein